MANRYANVKQGYAYDLSDNVYYKSGWERDFARFLTFCVRLGAVEGWEYEPQRFNFIGHYNSNPLFYVPDFVLQLAAPPKDSTANQVIEHIGTVIPEFKAGSTIYVEVKGQETGRDRNKLRRFRKVTGNTIGLVKRDEMLFLQESYGRYIPDWESKIR